MPMPKRRDERPRGRLSHIRAEPGGAGDGRQRPLVPRSLHLPRLTPSVRLGKVTRMTQTRAHLDTLFARWDWWLSLFAVVVGLLLLAFQLPAIGGAILGAGFSSAVTIVGGHAREEDLRLMLDGALPPGAFTTAERVLAPYRKTFHYYYTTEISGVVRWYYAPFDFSKDFAPGKLSASYIIRDRTYMVEGFLKRDCLILTIHSRIADHEREAVNVFSDFAKHFQDASFGVELHETWDGMREVGRCILSRKPLIQAQPADFVGDEQARSLQKEWDIAMQQLGWHLFPKVPEPELACTLTKSGENLQAKPY